MFLISFFILLQYTTLDSLFQTTDSSGLMETLMLSTLRVAELVLFCFESCNENVHVVPGFPAGKLIKIAFLLLFLSQVSPLGIPLRSTDNKRPHISIFYKRNKFAFEL